MIEFNDDGTVKNIEKDNSLEILYPIIMNDKIIEYCPDIYMLKDIIDIANKLHSFNIPYMLRTLMIDMIVHNGNIILKQHYINVDEREEYFEKNITIEELKAFELMEQV